MRSEKCLKKLQGDTSTHDLSGKSLTRPEVHLHQMKDNLSFDLLLVVN